MYCEEKILSSQFGDVEHIKPKSRFPSLKFEWNNLGFVCSRCNNAKSDKFDDSLPYLNPYDEDPSRHILFAGPMIFAKQASERGKITILDLKLDRVELFEKRLERLNQIDRTIGQWKGYSSNTSLKINALEELKNEYNDDKEHSLCVEYLLKSHEII